MQWASTAALKTFLDFEIIFNALEAAVNTDPILSKNFQEPFFNAVVAVHCIENGFLGLKIWLIHRKWSPNSVEYIENVPLKRLATSKMVTKQCWVHRKFPPGRLDYIENLFPKNVGYIETVPLGRLTTSKICSQRCWVHRKCSPGRVDYIENMFPKIFL